MPVYKSIIIYCALWANADKALYTNNFAPYTINATSMHMYNYALIYNHTI